MDRASAYYSQVKLLVALLPLVGKEQCFALKGGTAINLFVRDVPRLSVDIDLVYLPDADRNDALAATVAALDRIAMDIEAALPDSSVLKGYEEKGDALRLVIKSGQVSVKVELSPVMRGVVYEPEPRSVSAVVEDEFGFAEINMVSLADLYAGKLCAAFDRQHPRDFYDVLLLLENEGVTEQIRRAFVVYLVCHSRPMEELLKPRWKDIAVHFESEFLGMSVRQVEPAQLLDAAKIALSTILQEMSPEERHFLCSFYQDEPDLDALGIEGLHRLPALRWKLMNIEKMGSEKRAAALSALEKILEEGES